MRDIAGQRFGRLLAVEPTPLRLRRQVVWRFVCDCGEITEKPSGDVCSGKVTSCGCYRIEAVSARLAKVRHLGSEAKTTHGMTRTNTYMVWSGMIQRCVNENAPDFPSYGGRGITVCDRWLRSFEDFLADMGEQPRGLQIDRIDNDRGYEPGNCRWVTCKANMQNRRVSRKITHNGRTQNIKQWADEVGLSHQTIAYRLSSGWSVADALEKPAAYGNGWKNGNR